MAEYIERTALRETLYAADAITMQGVKILNQFPAADVAPVVHGRWEPCFEDWRKQIEGDKCSACGFEHYGCSIRNYHYCPNCGARCDLGGAENA